MTITTDQARRRFTIIPERLQDVVFSEQTAEIMGEIANQYHLDDKKIVIVGKITGFVLLGFIHTEDVSREIQTQLALQVALANDISNSLSAKIFNALQDDLTKVYAPVPKPDEGQDKTDEDNSGPTILSTAIAAPTAAPKPTGEMPSGSNAPINRPRR